MRQSRPDDPNAEPNADQIEFWNVVQGDKWVRLQDRIDAVLAPVGHAAMARLAPRPGEHVLDVGCGCGGTSLDLAERVAPGGSVTGIDVSAPMLRHAESRAAAAAAPITFIEADAQSYDFEAGRFDAVFSRVGVMFFAAPEIAFANLLAATRPGGRLAFACWRGRADNPWAMTAVETARRHLDLPPPPGPEEPGQFAFADDARVHRILETAGWADVAVEPFDTPVRVGSEPAEAAEFLMQMGPAAQPLKEAHHAVREQVARDLARALEPHVGPDGVNLDAGAWIVTARRP